MSYFSSFPLIQGYNIDGEVMTVIDITRIVGINESTKNNENNYVSYRVRDETPEVIADRLYDDAEMSWVILLFNNIFDINDQWPLSYAEFESYVTTKYGEDVHSIAHYKSLQTGAIVDSDHPTYDRLPVTNYEYEVEVNDRKRRIKVPTPEAAVEIKRSQRKALRQ